MCECVSVCVCMCVATLHMRGWVSVDNGGCPAFGSCRRRRRRRRPTLAAKLIYSCRQRPWKFEVALETELVVAFVFNESEVSDALYVC